MAKPKEVTMKKMQQKKALSMYKKGTTNPRLIAKELGVSRWQTMLLLEQQGFKKYSEGSYA